MRPLTFAFSPNGYSVMRDNREIGTLVKFEGVWTFYTDDCFGPSLRFSSENMKKISIKLDELNLREFSQVPISHSTS